MPLVSFAFSQEQLEATQTSTEGQRTLDGVVVGSEHAGGALPRDAAEVGGYLTGGRASRRIERLTDKAQYGAEWVPDFDASVVFTEADTWACFCCGMWEKRGCLKSVARFGLRFYRQTYTRAQWIYRFNALCLLVHVLMAYLSANACGATWPSNNENCTATNMTVHIYRLRANWTSAEANGYTLLPVDNEKPVRFDLITAWFFGLSAIFHAIPVIVGPFDRWAWAYWKCIDNAFSYWRWIEYSCSASLMILAIAVLLGVREQNQLAALFMLMFCTQMFGLLTELLARPGKRGDDGYRGWANDPTRSEAVLAAELKRRKIMEYPYLVKRHPRLPYHHAKEKLSLKERYRFENPKQVPVPDMLSAEELYLLTHYAQSYTLAWAQRMFPHVLGFFPYITIWVILIQHFLDSLNDVRKENEALWELIPDFVVPAVFGTLVIFSSFTFVQWRYLYISPDHWWRSEIWYCALSLTAKLFLGGFLYSNVLRMGSVEEALDSAN